MERREGSSLPKAPWQSHGILTIPGIKLHFSSGRKHVAHMYGLRLNPASMLNGREDLEAQKVLAYYSEV